MRFFNVHTHHATLAKNRVLISLGIHPWYVTENWAHQIQVLLPYWQHPRVAAIGECGIDKCRMTVPLTLQISAFRAQLQQACLLQKPIIIHCVKAFDELIRITSEEKKTWRLKNVAHSNFPPCVIHGFRGKPQQAEQLLEKGFFLSYGAHYNEQSLAITPMESLLLETDEAKISITELYRRAAHIKGISIEKFAYLIERSYFCTLLYKNNNQ